MGVRERQRVRPYAIVEKLRMGVDNSELGSDELIDL